MKYLLVKYDGICITVSGRYETIDEATEALLTAASSYNGFRTINEWKCDNDYWYDVILTNGYYRSTDRYWQIIEL